MGIFLDVGVYMNGLGFTRIFIMDIEWILP